MEALRHIAEGELYYRDTHFPWPERKSNPVTLFTAQLADDTGRLKVETKSCRVDTLREELSTAQPKMGDEITMDGQATARDNTPRNTSLEVIILPRMGERRRHRIGLDRDSLLEVYKYLDLDPWLICQLCRVSSSWTCCTFAEGILNFQLLTSMYYIAWSVNTSQGTTKTKAILMAQEHICYSRWFSADAMLEAILKASVVSLKDPFGFANLVLLDIISYMERELDSQWGVEVRNENLTGHGVFGYGHHEKISSLDTQHLAFAAREMGICIGMVSYCIRLAELAEQMVSDLRDEVQKFRRATQDGRHTSFLAKPWTDHSSFIQSLDSSKKRVWNFKVEAKNLDNRVRAQSDTVSTLLPCRQFTVIQRCGLTLHRADFRPDFEPARRSVQA